MRLTHEQTHRQYYLDWLRIGGILLVFLYHSVHFFDPNDWSVKNDTTYNWLSDLMGLLSVWLMPIIFLISGVSIFYAIKKTTIKKFIYDKIMRLLVPLLVGVFSFSIMQVYLERISHHQYSGSFFSFIPHYFEGVYHPGTTGNFAYHGMHLWYLLFLFIFTIVLMPFFFWYKDRCETCVVKKIMSLPGALLFLIIPTIIINNLNINILGNAGWTIIEYLWFFIAGYLLAANKQLNLQIIKSRWIWLFLTVALLTSSVLLQKNLNSHQDILVWLGLYAALGFSMKRLNYTNKFLAYSNQAVMPFYILHQNILLLLGYFIVQWTISDLSKYILIVVSTLILIIILYEFLIRRFNTIRILFGMKPIQKNDDTNNDKNLRVSNL